MNATTVFLEPLDVLYLRGNKLFGDAGSFGEALVPPWPSVAAGALRSRMLVDAKADPANSASWPPALGTPEKPASFTVHAFHLARRFADGRVERLIAPPADLVITRANETLSVRRLIPTCVSGGLSSSFELPLVPVLAEAERAKPASGYWLTQAAWQAYLEGKTPQPHQLHSSSLLWAFDTRVGVGLETNTRSVADGRLFTTQAVALTQRGRRIEDERVADFDVGFVASVAGAEVPTSGLVRLGGDGRGAALHPVKDPLLDIDPTKILATRRCRIVLTTPGLLAAGWLPTGAEPDERRKDGAVRFALAGVSGWIVCAAVPRFEVVSGWDLARWQPKPALRAAPAGSVYWLELDESVTDEALRALTERGLWTEEEFEQNPRRAEGFNRFTFALCGQESAHWTS
jgi:CRISPR-associated protein Cmr3